ncbi:MAG TPA: hypothetical protein VJW76_04205 [Verrucomicrobiae bacterium]|nr:hypothetical protein [Verrucomicrobiae bacterium]
MKTNSSAVIVPAPVPATTTNTAAAEDIRDIKAPVEIPSGWAWLWWTLGAMVVAVAVFAAVRYWLKHRPKAKAITIVIPPHERARRKLQEALGLLDQPRPFCILVSDAVRLYLEEAFSMRAPERTTEEFLDELQSSAVLALTQKQLLGDFLMRCDLVKFARHEPPQDQLQELYQSALRLIDETQSLIRTEASTVGPNPASPITEPSAADRQSEIVNRRS